MKLLPRLAISCGVAIIAAFTMSTPLIEEIDFRVSDQIFRFLGNTTPPAKVVVVGIDEQSYSRLNVPFGPPWPRALHARLLNRLKELGAKRVAFDVLFVDPGPDPEIDAALSNAMGLLPTVIGAENTITNVKSQGGISEIENIELPHERFQQSAELALVGLDETNGIIRTFPFNRSELEAQYPRLAEAAAGFVDGSGSPRPGKRDLIRYYGAGGSIPLVPYYELFEKETPGDRLRFQDAIVFVGIRLRSHTGAAKKDSYLTPFGAPMMYGVEVHATIANNLLTQSWITRPSQLIEITWQAILLGAISFLGLSATPIVLLIISATSMILWVIGALWGLHVGFYLCGSSSVLIGAPVIILVSTLHSYLTSRKSEESLKSAFSLYLSPEMLPELQRDGSSLKLGGEKLWLTALFTDIADFTSITEEMPAERTSEMLNAYFTEVMEVVFQNQGTLIKFIGDAVFAIWGAPVKMTNHAELAVKTALAIQQEVTKFNSTNRFPPLITRIGINTGPMLVGNLGSKRRFDYTAIGDSVNLSARLEGINKYFGTLILFSEATRRDAGGIDGSVAIAKVRVKGKKESVPLYTVFETPLASTVLTEWNKACDEFSQTQFESARLRFEKLATAEPRLEKASKLYIAEITQWLESPPPFGWGGELTFDSK